jgi:hypothetical protein
MNTPIRISIDMETVDNVVTAGIISLGAVQFALPHGYEAPQFYAKADVRSSEMLGRTISKGTMEWWDRQDPEIRNEAFSGVLSLGELLDQFYKWCVSTYGVDRLQDIELWSRGAGFDCEILQHAYLQLWGSYPFNFRNHLCQRTIERLMPQELKSMIPPNFGKHNALMDAIHQASVLNVAFNNLRWYVGEARHG